MFFSAVGTSADGPKVVTEIVLMHFVLKKVFWKQLHIHCLLQVCVTSVFLSHGAKANYLKISEKGTIRLQKE